jgi:hypothetical protein
MVFTSLSEGAAPIGGAPCLRKSEMRHGAPKFEARLASQHSLSLLVFLKHPKQHKVKIAVFFTLRKKYAILNVT